MFKKSRKSIVQKNDSYDNVTELLKMGRKEFTSYRKVGCL